MKLRLRLALLAVALAPVAALGDASPQVVLATPGVGATRNEGGAIERFTARLSQPMVPLGDPRAAGPFDVTCAVGGTGRWVDPQTFVHDFANSLPGGTVCEFKLRAGLKSVSGYAVTGQQSFKVDAGGPVARAVLPGQYDSEIEEDQVFLVAANLPATPASVAANAYCAVDGVGEKIPVDVLGADLAGKLLGAIGTDNWNVRSFLENGGLPAAIPERAEDRARAYAGVTALKCRRALPPGRDMALVWGAGIAGAGGKTAGAAQRFDYTVRKPFTARWECTRTNAAAGCSPVENAFVRFTAPIALADARTIRLTTADGKAIAPKFDKDDEKKATISDVTFVTLLPFATAARLTLPAGLKDESGRVLDNARRFPLDVRFDAAPPLVKFAATFGILEAKQGGVLPVTVRGVEPALQGKLDGIDGQALRIDASDGKVAQWLRTVADADDEASHEIKRGKTKVTINDTGSRSILGRQGTALKVGLSGAGKDFEVVGIPVGGASARPGFYVVELASPVLGAALLGRAAPRYVAAAALVTNMSVHFKWGRARSLAWVTTLDTGKPVADAAVRITDSCTGAVLAHGTTDRSGAVFVPSGIPAPETYGSCDASEHPLMISARSGDDYSFTLTAWGEGIRPYDFDLPYGYSAPGELLHTVFDRALVRQGETVHMKHLLRRSTADGFALVPAVAGTLRLTHRGSDTQFELPLAIDASGTGENAWTAPAGAPMGDYDVQAIAADGRTISSGQSLRVDKYKLPTMRATVTGPKEALVRPGSVPLDLFVGYLSGGGASNLPVHMRVGWFAREAKPDGYEGYTFGGKAIAEGTRPLNGDGEEEQTPLPPTQTLPATLGGDGTGKQTIQVPAGLDGATDMLVEMDYEDANGEVLTASRRLPVYPSAVQLGIKTDGWLMTQDDLRLRFVALDTQGRPIANQQVAVALYSRKILTARRRLIGGFYAYDNRMQTEKLAQSCTATTDAQGLAMCRIDPGVSGEVYAVATTKDGNGNAARATQSVWLVGDEDWWFGGDNGDRMDVVPEKLEYKAGAVARFQVRMPFRQATALVTVEREGVLSSFVTELSGTDPVVEVEMPGSYAPDVFVSVMAVRGRTESGWWSWMGGIARTLGLAGGPPEGQEPTALVDLAKPSYRLGIARVKVGWDAHRLQVAVRADKARYAAREVAQVDVQVRTPDGKPAASADVAFAAVDEALLQLAPNASWDVLDAVMGERPLSVLTSTAQTQVVGKRHYGKKAVEAGGDGGGADSSGLNRENFQPVLLWRGHVALAAAGRARVAVPMSDALSSFKLVAIATDGAQFYGTGIADVRTAQDLSIFAGIPSLVRTGDFYASSFTLRNGSDKPMTVTANVDLTPAIARGKPLTVTIPAGGAVPVSWNVTAPAELDSLKWHVSARSADGKAVDQVTVAQQVVPAIPLEIWAGTLVRVGANTSILIQPPAGAIAGRGMVDIRLDDTLAPPLAGVRAFMARYPYDCFEQQLSRAIVLGDGAAWSALAADIPAYQADDGLLRYWPSGNLSGSEALTAYVLSISADAGFVIPEAPRARMIEGLRAVLDGRLRHEDYGDVRWQRVYAFNALARAGAARPQMLGQIGMTPAEMPASMLSDYLVALDHVSGLANAPALRRAGEAELRRRLVYEGTRLDLSDQDREPWWLMSSADSGAIKAVLATLGRPGWQDDAPKMMVGVALRQARGRWDTTTANAWGTIAARKFAVLYPASAITGTTTLALGAQSVGKAWPLAPTARTAQFALPAAATPLRLSHSGAGPWANVSVSAAVPLTQPLFAGYTMTRKMDVVQARTPGTLTRGDVVRVAITVTATAERNWVVVNDPIPAGATIVGDLGGQSQLLNGQSRAGDGYNFTGKDSNGKLWAVQVGVQPAYIERRNDSWRGYFAWVPRGTFTIVYLMRLNGAGRFNLPPARVEAMYSPAIRAQLPGSVVAVAQR